MALYPLVTPKRIAKSFTEMLDGYAQSPKEALGSVFEDGVCDEMIMLKKLPFYSMCEHHLLPFFGFISIGYIPDSKLVGISGLARLAEVFTHRLQIQEQLTAQIANALMSELSPKGVIVVCEARHLCLEMRGKQRHFLFNFLNKNAKFVGIFPIFYINFTFSLDILYIF